MFDAVAMASEQLGPIELEQAVGRDMHLRLVGYGGALGVLGLLM